LSKAASKGKSGTTISQRDAENLMMRYVVDSLSPISHVEHHSFVALVHGFAPHINIFFTMDTHKTH